MMTRPREEASSTMTRRREIVATLSLTRLNTTRSLTGRRDRGLRHFRPPSAHAPTLSPAAPQLAQGKARTLFSLSLPLWTPRPSSQMNSLFVAQCRQQLLRYFPQRRAGFPQKLRKRFNFCILPSLVFTYNRFCELCFHTSYQVSSIPSLVRLVLSSHRVPVTWVSSIRPFSFLKIVLRSRINTFILWCRTMRFLCSAYCA